MMPLPPEPSLQESLARVTAARWLIKRVLVAIYRDLDRVGGPQLGDKSFLEVERDLSYAIGRLGDAVEREGNRGPAGTTEINDAVDVVFAKAQR